MQEIKRRIKSVESTKKITKAMELVATSKLRKTRNQLEQSKPYYTNVAQTVAEILANCKGNNDSIYLVENKDIEKEVFIVIASSLGLCGGYNANIFKEIKGAIKPGDYVYSIGSKATSYLLKNHQGVTDHKFDDLNTTFDFKDVTKLVAELTKMYREKEISKTKDSQCHDIFCHVSGTGICHNQYGYPQAVHAQGSEGRKAEVPLRNAVP